MTVTAAQVKAEAMRLGFIACGITSLGVLPHGLELDRWLRLGYAGNMRYIHRQARKRKNPQLVEEAARSAVVILDNYYSNEADDAHAVTKQQSERPSTGRGPRLARYARGEDYHRVTLRRLEELAGFLRSHGARTARPFVDAGPVAERELAQRAGLGWIGKNTMLIRPGVGSWFFIAEVLTDLELEADSPFPSDHCGICTRCLEACPTQAFVEPRVLDATRCISYVTIEQKGPIASETVSRLSGWAFGCDICNEVCPWNERFASPTTVPEFQARGATAGAAPDLFEQMNETEFAARFGDTPLARTGLDRMRRNWAAAWDSLR